jgi:chlorite dismutase
MTETLTRPEPAATAEPKTAFACFWLYQRAESWYTKDDAFWAEADSEALALLKGDDRPWTIRGTYSAIGLSANVDLIVWGVAPTLDTLQGLAVQVDKTKLGRNLRLREVYYGVGGMSKYDPTHGPAFIKGDEPRRYLSVYPFMKTPTWFLLPFQERRDLMIEHGKLGRDFPTVLTNTVSSFGISTPEWIVALEDDSPEVLVAMVQKLREAKVREWTAVDTPIYLGERKPAADVLKDLHG